MHSSEVCNVLFHWYATHYLPAPADRASFLPSQPHVRVYQIGNRLAFHGVSVPRPAADGEPHISWVCLLLRLEPILILRLLDLNYAAFLEQLGGLLRCWERSYVVPKLWVL